MSIKFFEVGGSVRDRMLGLDPKDFDYSVEAPSYEAMLAHVDKTHDKIFLEKPEFLTIRAKKGGEIFDYVMCRKEGAYSDGRHPDLVEPGTIYDDLARRDFTVNAMAREVGTDVLLDPHGGAEDVKSMTLRCVGSTHDRFAEDPLRVLRAMRFCIMKGFNPSKDIKLIFSDSSWAREISRTVSQERIREEIKRCFQFDSVKTMQFIVRDLHPQFAKELFRSKAGDGLLWLDPTNRKK
jgi:tRNA nucleotidyltransferase (CCA-adding enzyme)